MGDELAQVADPVRDEADLDARGAKLVQHRQHVLEELEVLGDLPAVLDLGRALRRDLRRTPHPEEDLLREAVPDRVVVQELGMALEVEHRGLARLLVAAEIEVETVTRGDPPVAFCGQLRARPAECEVDVEEDCPQRHHSDSSSQPTVSTCRGR